MSKKKLILNETVTRRFMRLAEIDAKFSDEFLNELGMGEDEMEVPMGGGEEEELPGDEGPEEEMPPEEPMGDTVEVDAEELVSDIVAALQKQGADVSMEGDEEELPAEDGEELEPVAGDEELPPEEEEPLMQELAKNVTITSDEDMVNEVARRVAARLVAAAKTRK